MNPEQKWRVMKSVMLTIVKEGWQKEYAIEVLNDLIKDLEKDFGRDDES